MDPDFITYRQTPSGDIPIRGYLEGDMSSEVLVILCHGLMLHCDINPIRYFKTSLNESGYATLRFDFAGTGISGGEMIDMTPLTAAEDLECVVSFCCRNYTFRKIVLMGHSLGGVVCSIVAPVVQGQIDGMVLMAPAGVIADDAKSGKAGYETFDTDNVPEYIELWGQKLGRDYLMVSSGLDIYGRAAAFKGRTCIIHGSEDVLVPVRYSEMYRDALKDSTLYIIPGGDHFFIRSKKHAMEIVINFLKKNF